MQQLNTSVFYHAWKTYVSTYYLVQSRFRITIGNTVLENISDINLISEVDSIYISLSNSEVRQRRDSSLYLEEISRVHSDKIDYKWVSEVHENIIM